MRNELIEKEGIIRRASLLSSPQPFAFARVRRGERCELSTLDVFGEEYFIPA